MTTKAKVWRDWTNRYVETEDPIPLFETDLNSVVQYKHYGKNGRRILKRSERMDDRIRSEGQKVLDDWESTDKEYDGLIYLMYWLDNNEVVPLYVGKAGKYGKDSERLSTNLEGLHRESTGKFARWGDGHDYHIGDLSAIVFDHDKKQKLKYEYWANRLFEDGTRKLCQQTYHWTKAWSIEDVGLYHDFEVSLGHLEYLLIGMSADLYPNRLLNNEGA